MSRDDEILLDLIKATQLIIEFTAEMNEAEFINDEKTQSSVLYQMIILGEAVNRLSDSFKAKHPNIPFAQIKGMRNRVTHEYKEVDFVIVWDTIENDIPQLLTLLLPLTPTPEGE